MNSIIVVLVGLLAVAQASFLLDYTLQDEDIQNMAFREKTRAIVISQCLDVEFNYCQARFNTFFGLDEEVNFRNGTLIFNTVQKYLEMNTTEFIKVCNTRTQYYQCLGSTYYSCLSLYSILNRPNPDFPNAFDYVRTFRGLEYACTGGFEQVVNQWECLGTFPTTKHYTDCITTFNNTVSAGNFCPAVDAAGACLNDAYKASCGTAAGYFGCENFRTTFDDSCWGLRCTVNN